jgi:hypothetical protein
VTAPEELRKAAARLRDLAADTSAAPWWSGSSGSRVYEVRVDGNALPWAPLAAYLVERAADAGWIATMHPGIAHPLADWLESVADAHIHLDDREISAFDLPGTDTHPALDVARIINGGQP